MNIKKFEAFSSDLQGWVNVKIDKQLYIRMARHIPALDKLTGVDKKYDLKEKLTKLNSINDIIENNDGSVSIRDKISILTILQYLKELKSQFNPSSAGFLIEGFLATLIYGKLSEDPHDYADIKSYGSTKAPVFKAEDDEDTTIANRLTYQIKLYKDSGSIKVRVETPCDFYVICLKNSDVINIYVLSHEELLTYAGGKRVPAQEGDLTKSGKQRVYSIVYNTDTDVINLNVNKLKNNGVEKINLDLSKIDYLIKSCGNNIHSAIEKTYDQLSQLHYDIDSIVIGIDKNRKPITVDEASLRAETTIKNIEKEVSNLSKNLKA